LFISSPKPNIDGFYRFIFIR